VTASTLLLRQVNPSWLQHGRITSQVFKPTPKDNERLSVYDGDQISPERSWGHYTTTLGHVSVGVMAVTVAECDARRLPVEPDPTPFPAHAVIRFDGFSNSQKEKSAKYLKRAAENRGWQYRADATG